MNDPNAFAPGWSQPSDLVGQVLADRYQIISVMGEGGMGSVFLAEHTTLRKKVAIKVLHHELCRDKTQVDRFLQEARAASMIGHENIVDIVDFGPVPGGSVFFAMEHLEGEDLADLLIRERRIAWPRAKELTLQIIRALAAAHTKGIIHRDLKPANCFLIKRSDGRDFVKLLDFGIAKVTDPESGDGGGLTRTGAVFGTAKYMAPEQAVGDPADQRTDIYAAAICLYEFLTGNVPYDGDNFMRVLSRHLTEPLTPPSTMAPDAGISAAIEATIVKALSKKPEDRYQSMPEFEQALLAIGPDGNLLRGHDPGPPRVGAHQANAMEGPEGTMWLTPGQGSQGPASQPPEGRGGTMLLDPDAVPPELEFGTVKLGPTGWNQAGPPPGGNPAGTYVMDPPAAVAPHSVPPGGSAITNHPSAPSRPPGMPTNPPGPSTAPNTHGPGGDYTMFATEKRSPVKFIAMLVGGATLAIGGGGLVAWLLLGDSGDSKEDDTEEKEVVAAKADIEAPKKEATPPPPTDELEIAVPPPVDDPPPVKEVEDDPPEVKDPPPADDPPPEKTPATTTSRPSGKGKGKGGKGKGSKQPTKIKDALSPADVSKGFARASGKVKACKGGIPGMRIKVRATIRGDGSVIDAKALSQAGLPVGKCAAKAVKNNARFAKTKKGLDSKEWTFKF